MQNFDSFQIPNSTIPIPSRELQAQFHPTPWVYIEALHLSET